MGVSGLFPYIDHVPLNWCVDLTLHPCFGVQPRPTTRGSNCLPDEGRQSLSRLVRFAFVTQSRLRGNDDEVFGRHVIRDPCPENQRVLH